MLLHVSNVGRIVEPPGIENKFDEMCFGTLTTLWRHIVNFYRRFDETYCWYYSESRTAASPWRWMQHFLRKSGNCRECLYPFVSLETSSESGRRRCCKQMMKQPPISAQSVHRTYLLCFCLTMRNFPEQLNLQGWQSHFVSSVRNDS
jgi:hypothetical protein